MTNEIRQALEFYANPLTYRSPSTGFALQYDPMPSPIALDEGQRAKLALQHHDERGTRPASDEHRSDAAS